MRMPADPRFRTRWIIIGMVAAVSLGTALLVRSVRRPYQARIPEGVRVGGLEVGGLDGVGATGLLQPLVQARANQTWTLRLNGRTWLVTPSEVGIRYSLDDSLSQALAAARSQPWWERAWGPGPAGLAPRDIVLAWTFDEASFSRLADRLAAEIDRPAQNASYDLRSGRAVPDRAGLSLDRGALRRAVEEAVQRQATEITIPVRTIPPAVKEADLAAVGRQRLSTFTTRVNLADADRVANIALAVKKINGTLLRPGDTFSFNEIVGPREPVAGFRQAKEIYQGEYVLGYGGGVCQVSSTLYNAALLADLGIAARSHHSRPLSYVETGRDATVAYDYLDFRFTNTSRAPVLLVASLEADQLTASILGRAFPSSRRVEVVTRDLITVQPPMREEMDETLPWRARQVISQGEPGYEVTVLRRVIEGGRLVRDEVISHDKYPPRPGLVRVGLRPPLMGDGQTVPTAPGASALPSAPPTPGMPEPQAVTP